MGKSEAKTAHNGLLAIAIITILSSAESCYYSTTLYATKTRWSTSVSISNNEICTFYIRPSSYYGGTSYFLEISWSSSYFDIKGNMPLCKEDYVEVFLTRSYKSVGKFCSNNAGAPFSMYSHDGYAKIVFSTDGSISGKTSKFYYKLVSNATGSLGGSPTNTLCYNENNYRASGVIYSTGWPIRYQSSALTCKYKIERSSTNHGVYVAFLDINLNQNGPSNDFVQMYGSNSSSIYNTAMVSDKLYNMTYYVKSYITYAKYLRINFDRNNGGGLSFRGFVAGYVMFGESKEITESSDGFPALYVGVPGGIILCFILLCMFGGKVRRRRRNAAVALSRARGNATVSVTQRTTTQQTVRNYHSSIFIINSPSESQNPSAQTNRAPGSAYPTLTATNTSQKFAPSGSNANPVELSPNPSGNPPLAMPSPYTPGFEPPPPYYPGTK